MIPIAREGGVGCLTSNWALARPLFMLSRPTGSFPAGPADQRDDGALSPPSEQTRSAWSREDRRATCQNRSAHPQRPFLWAAEPICLKSGSRERPVPEISFPEPASRLTSLAFHNPAEPRRNKLPCTSPAPRSDRS